jgi:hypothetical protein
MLPCLAFSRTRPSRISNPKSQTCRRRRACWACSWLFVGVSVVNALSERLEVEVALGGQLYRQVFARGIPKSGLEKLGRTPNRRGTKVRFKPDPQIFGDKAKFNPQRLFKMARAKAYLFGGVEIRWHCDKALLHGIEGVPEDRRRRRLPVVLLQHHPDRRRRHP